MEQELDHGLSNQLSVLVKGKIICHPFWENLPKHVDNFF